MEVGKPGLCCFFSPFLPASGYVCTPHAVSPFAGPSVFRLRLPGAVCSLLLFHPSLRHCATRRPTQILRSIKSRCGKRLTRGDFALTSDALVLAVRDSRPNGSTEVGGDGAGDGGGGDAGDIVAVVELCLRQPDGWFPINGPFVVRYCAAVPLNDSFDVCVARIRRRCCHGKVPEWPAE